jgi:hypothetical protein
MNRAVLLMYPAALHVSAYLPIYAMSLRDLPQMVSV